MPPRDCVSRLIAYESGEFGFADTVALFQELIDSGLAWELQGHYGRTAARLIEAGYCRRADGESDPETGCRHVWGGDDVCVHCGQANSDRYPW